MNLDWKVWAIGGVGLVAAFVLLRNKNTTTTSTTNTQTTTTTPVGQSYSYLDGSGMQHLTATDPNGNLTYYQTLPPGTSMDQTGQIASYVGLMGHNTNVPAMMGYTPYYAGTINNVP